MALTLQSNGKIIYGGLNVSPKPSADLMRMTTGFSGDADPVTNWTRQSDAPFSGLPWSGMSESSGVWTFPDTGIWLVSFHREAYLNGDDREVRVFIRGSTDNFSSVENLAEAATHIQQTESSNTHASVETSALVDVTNTSNVKVRFKVTCNNSSTNTIGSSSSNRTYAQFIRIGDT